MLLYLKVFTINSFKGNSFILMMNNNKNIEKDKIKSLEVFSGVIAHEFNNLLSGIQAWAQIGAKEKSQKNITLAFKNINKACERGTTLATSLLHFSRSQELKLSSVDINRLLDEAFDLLSVQLKKKNIKIKKEYSNIDKLKVDKGKIYQVFLNLIINSRDAVPDNGNITVKTLQKNDFVEIYFLDNGKGIPREDLKKIFKPFYSTKKSNNNSCSGTGLGLAIAKDIIRRHRGEITVSSEKLKGTEFLITLPLVQPEPST